MRQFGQRNIAPDSRQQHVLQRQAGMRTTSALDYWDQLVTLHYGSRVAICAHFREATVADTAMAWAGAPFAVPGTIALANSILGVVHSGRAFLYNPLQATDTLDKLASVALTTTTVGDYVGLRLDDASDNNYLEVVLYVSQATPTQWVVRTRRRTGGGAVTTQDSDTLCNDPGYVLRMDMTGTRWTAWNAIPVLHTNMGFNGWMYKPNVALGGANLAFTPTRAGVVSVAGAVGETDMGALADWFDIGR